MLKQLVGIHWNSHKKCWSVVNFKSRKTIGLLSSHEKSLVLSDVSFKVDISKYKKAKEKGVKDRHTFIVGYMHHKDVCIDNLTKIQYDVKDLIEPFKSVNNDSLIGKSLFFDVDMKVYLIS